MTSKDHFQLHIDVQEEHITAVDFLSAHCHLSKQRIKQAMRNGSVWLTHNKKTDRLRRAKKALSVGDQVHFYYDIDIQDRQSTAPVLLEDNGTYSIWHKPRGMFSQGSKWGDHCAIARWIETHHLPQRPAFIIHRLDRATSGIMLIAHSKKTAAFLANQFETRLIKKHYLAITASPLTKTAFTISNELNGKKAISHFDLLEHNEPYSLFAINIETGRKHQIRQHMAQAKMSILGDRLYGEPQQQLTPAPQDLQLTAYKLSYQCPVEKVTKTYELPAEYRPTINALLNPTE